jgi:hypothetical protein
MQGDNAVAGMEPYKEKPIDPKSVDPEPTSLPRYTIKTVGPSGWENIDNAEQWTDLLLRRSLEVWTDGVVNMIIELVDVPV